MKFVDTNGSEHDTRIGMFISNTAAWIVDKICPPVKDEYYDDDFEFINEDDE